MLFLVLWSNIQSYGFLLIQSSGLGLRVPVYGSSSLISVKNGQGEKNTFSKTRGRLKHYSFWYGTAFFFWAGSKQPLKTYLQKP